MSRFSECLHGDVAEIGDTGELTEGELRALVQNLCNRVAVLQARADYMRDRIATLETSENA
jgi:hypothetical protein